MKEGNYIKMSSAVGCRDRDVFQNVTNIRLSRHLDSRIFMVQ